LRGNADKHVGPLFALAIPPLAKNKHLTALDITGSRISDEGAAALGQALRKNRTLTSLHMGKYDYDLD
jgi:hypothetical protein